MGIKERRERERLEIRRRILAAAQQIITKEGFAKLSMRKLAAEIEYSPAAIYLHFQSRDQIARELGQAGFRQLLRLMTDAGQRQQPKQTAAQRLKAVAEAYVAFGIEHPETYRLIFMSDAEYMAAAFAEPAADDPAQRSLELLVELGAELKRDKSYRGEDSPEELAEMIWAAMHGVVSLRLTCPGFQITSTEALAARLTKTLVDGLLGSPVGATPERARTRR